MSTKARRTNISISPAVRKMADELMDLRAYSELSGFLSQLIREEWERRHGPARFPPPTPSDSPDDLTTTEERPPDASDVIRARLGQRGSRPQRPTDAK